MSSDFHMLFAFMHLADAICQRDNIFQQFFRQLEKAANNRNAEEKKVF